MEPYRTTLGYFFITAQIALIAQPMPFKRVRQLRICGPKIKYSLSKCLSPEVDAPLLATTANPL